MKKIILSILSLSSLHALPAQSPVYVLFNSGCMDQLEYRYTKSGNSVFAYSVRPNADEQYIFMSGESGMPTQTLPEGTYDCRNLALNDETVRTINQQSAVRQMYIIIQRPQDYLMMPVYSATQIKRVASYYLLVSPKFVFAIDTTRLSYQDNLQGESSPSVIRFTGSKLANCRYQYSFHGEPARNYKESMDFDFIFGLGIINNRIGATTVEQQDSEMRLIGVNGSYLENYLAGICQNTLQANTTGNSASKWTGTAETGYLGEDKEQASAAGNANTWKPDQGAQSGMQHLLNCPEQPGPGYHIVQRGESLKAIARTYNVDLKSVIRWNNIKNPDHIEVCQKIWLQKPAAEASAASKGISGQSYAGAGGPTVFNQSVYWNQNTTPGQYNYTPNQYNYSPAQYNTPQTGVHYVQKGETLFGIAKRYGCAEECFRRANNMPLEGNVTIKAGQTLVIPECTCQTTGQAAVTYNASRTAAPVVPPEVSNLLNNQTQTQAPVVYDYKTVRQDKPVVTNPLQGINAAPGQQQQSNLQGELPPTQEYIVRQGETMNSIAIKFKMSVAELAQLNSVGQDEKLAPGKRLVVRRY